MAKSEVKKSKRTSTAIDEAETVEVEAGDVTMEEPTVEGGAPKAKKAKKDDDKEIPKEAISAIAKPLAGKKMGKHVLKLVKKG